MVQKQVKLSSLRLVIKMENLSRVSLTWRSMLLVLVHLMLSFTPNILKQVNQLLYRRFYKNREFQIMRLPDHPNVVPLRNCYKNEVYLNVFVEYVPETVYRMSRHYVRMN